MSRLFSLLGASVLLAVLVCPAQAESGWKLPNLNPFSKKTNSSASKKSSFKMPSLIPSWGEKKSHSSQPSTWSKMTDGTKDFFSKTADMLNPWDTPSSKKTHSSFNKKKEKKSLFASWFSQKEEPRKPRSVAEFLKQPRPTP